MTIPAKNKLQKNVDFLRVLRGKTKKVEAVFGRVVVAERQSSVARFGFVISKRALAGSVVRNLMKRRASEWIRKRIFLFREGFDAVFVFEKETAPLSRRALYKELERACGRAGLFRHEYLRGTRE